MGERLDRLGREGLPPGSAGAYLFAASCAGLAAVAHIVFLQFAKEIMPSIFYNPAVFVAALLGGYWRRRPRGRAQHCFSLVYLQLALRGA